jgi:glycosidase
MKRHRGQSNFILLALLLGTVWSLSLGCRRAPQGESPQTYGHLHGVSSPAWVQKTILYEVFVRAFSEEGTFQRVTERLPELRELGVGTVWLMPIHPIGKLGRKGSLGCPYSVRDYFAVTPEYGTEEDLRQLVNTAHQLGLKVIIDWVANHSANDHVEMANHPDWFARDDQGQFTREVADWWDVTDFNYENLEMREYMKGALLYWVREFDIDGYRCDVAGMVPEDFWTEVRSVLHDVKPDIFLLAEWEDPKMHLKQFDATYDWSLYHTLKSIRKGEEKAERAIDLVLEKEAQYPRGSLRMRFIENHDEQRAAKIFGLQGYRPFATFIFTQRGTPLIYAGQEAADTVKPTLFDKVEVPWSEADLQVTEFYQELTRLRSDHSVFVHGETVKIPTDRPSEIVAYARRSDDHVAIVALNFSDREVAATLRLPGELRKGRDNLSFVTEKEESIQMLSKPQVRVIFEPFDSIVYLSEERTDR